MRAGRSRWQEDSGEQSASEPLILIPAGRPREPRRLYARVTSVQLLVQLACARGHLHAPEEGGCKELHRAHKERLDLEHLNREGKEEKVL